MQSPNGITVFVGNAGSAVVPVLVAPGAPLQTLTSKWLALRATSLFCIAKGASTASAIPTSLCLGSSGELINPQCTLADIAALLAMRPGEFLRVVAEDGAISQEASLQPLWQNAAFGQSVAARDIVARRVAFNRDSHAIERLAAHALDSEAHARVLSAEASTLADILSRCPGKTAPSSSALDSGMRLERLLPGAAASSLADLRTAVARACTGGGISSLHACFAGWLTPHPSGRGEAGATSALRPRTAAAAPVVVGVSLEELRVLLRCAGLGDWAADAPMLRNALLKVKVGGGLWVVVGGRDYRGG